MMLIIGISMPGCSSVTKEGRRQAAVRHQIQKIQKEKRKRLAKEIKAANRPLRQPVTVSEPKTTVTLEPMGSESAAASTEDVAAPVVVETGASPQPTP
jgi:hypothetical protein